jgi:hypothetical protein
MKRESNQARRTRELIERGVPAWKAPYLAHNEIVKENNRARYRRDAEFRRRCIKKALLRYRRKEIAA